MRIGVVVYPAEEGGYWARVPALPGVYAQGETTDELEANIREAIGLYLTAHLADVGESRAGGARLVEVEL